MATYFNSLKSKKSNFWIKLSGRITDVIAELEQHQKNGWINIELKERKEPGKYGETHLFTIDDYEPKNKLESYKS